ncbi:MAG: hypothetical protein LAT82_02550 [Nanoarchaeota archaeon]|nr:hypothetical protein [Nanoarchaeota archaeon]
MYLAQNLVLVPNFRSKDDKNPYKNRSNFCPLEEISYIEFSQLEIDEFVRRRTHEKSGLEELMQRGKYNVTPFMKDDSLLPILYGGFMLGEGCMTIEEIGDCIDPLGEYDGNLLNGDNLNSYFHRQNKFFENCFLSSRSKLSSLGLRNSARESKFRPLNLEIGIDVVEETQGIQVNDVTRLIRIGEKNFVELSQSELEVLSNIESNPFIKFSLGSSQTVFLTRLNNKLSQLMKFKILRKGGHDNPYALHLVQN